MATAKAIGTLLKNAKLGQAGLAISAAQIGKDELKALNEFCFNSGFIFEVIAFSFSTKQVAIKLKKN